MLEKEFARSTSFPQETLVVPAAASFGASKRYMLPYQVTGPPIYLAQLSSTSILAGTRYIFDSADIAMHDELASFWNDHTIEIKARGTKRAPDRNVIVTFSREPNTRIPAGIHLMNEYSNNYFHFIAEILPRLMFADAGNIPPDIPLLMDEGLHENFLRLIDLLNVNRRSILPLKRNVLYKVDDLFYPSDAAQVLEIYRRPPTHEEAFLPVGQIKKARGLVRNRLAIDEFSQKRRKLYISQPNGIRRLLNEPELIAKLIDRDFEVVNINGLPIEAQIKLFASADLVIMPYGDAAANVIWCNPGCCVIILLSDSPAHNTFLWRLIALVGGARIAFQVGPRATRSADIDAANDDYNIDIPLLLNELKALNAATSASH